MVIIRISDAENGYHSNVVEEIHIGSVSTDVCELQQ